MSETKTFTHELTVTVRVRCDHVIGEERDLSMESLQWVIDCLDEDDYKGTIDTPRTSTAFELKRITNEVLSEAPRFQSGILDVDRLGTGKAIVKTRNSTYEIRKHDCGGFGVSGGVLEKEEIYDNPPYIVGLDAPMFFGEYRTSRVESVTYAPIVIDATEIEQVVRA